MQRWLDEPFLYSTCMEFTLERWINTLRKWFLQGNHRAVIGKPSVGLAAALQEEERTFVAARVAALGSGGLDLLGEVLSAAEASNATEAPPSLIASFPMAKMRDTKAARFSSVLLPGGESRPRPLAGPQAKAVCDVLEVGGVASLIPTRWFHLDESATVTIRLVLSLEALCAEELQLLPLWTECAFEHPVTLDGQRGATMASAEFAAKLDEHLQAFGATVGWGGDGRFAPGLVAGTLVIHTKSVPDNASLALRLLSSAVCEVQFDPAILRVGATRLLSGLHDLTQAAGQVKDAILTSILFHDGSVVASMNGFGQRKVLKDLLASRDGGVHRMRQMTAKMLGQGGHGLSGATLHVTGDLLKMDVQELPMGSVFTTLGPAPKLAPEETRPFPRLSSMRRAPVARASPEAFLASSDAWDAAQVSVCLDVEVGENELECAALACCLQLLNAEDGLLHQKLRGKGICYGHHFSHWEDAGLICLELHHCTAPVQALVAVRDIIGEMIARPAMITSADHEAAVSGQVFSLVADVETPHVAASTAAVHSLAGLPTEHTSHRLAALTSVTREDVIRSLSTSVAPMLSPGTPCVCVVVAPSHQRDACASGLRLQLGLHVHDFRVGDVEGLFPRHSEIRPRVTRV